MRSRRARRPKPLEGRSEPGRPDASSSKATSCRRPACRLPSPRRQAEQTSKRSLRLPPLPAESGIRALPARLGIEGRCSQISGPWSIHCWGPGYEAQARGDAGVKSATAPLVLVLQEFRPEADNIRTVDRVMDPLLAWRKEFPILASTTYMVSHSLGAMPRRASDALAQFTGAWATRGIRAWEEGWWNMPVTVG